MHTRIRRSNSVAWAELHGAVLLFGAAGLLGRVLPLPPVEIVFARAAFAAATLGLILLVTRRDRARLLEDHASPTATTLSTIRRVDRFNGRSMLNRFLILCMGGGIILALHWVAFFQAIQSSGVAIGLLTFASFPLFVTLLEPWVFRERPRAIDLLTASLVVPGLALIMPDFHLGNAVTRGALWGIASGALFAVLSLLNRRLVRGHSAMTIAAIENLAAAVVLLPLLRYFGSVAPSRSQWLLLAAMGIFCTALAHTAFVRSLARVRAQPASVAAALEPVYGIALAALILHEFPGPSVLIGGAIVVAAAVLSAMTRAET